MADWQAIKTEYITTDTSYRKLSAKYGVGFQAICHRSQQEGWIAAREQYRNDTISKTVKKISDRKAERAVRVQTVADKLLLRIEAMVDGDSPLDTKGIRALTAAIKDLKEIQGVKSELDRQEQEARIAALRQRSMTGDGEDDDTGVIILPTRLGEGADDG